MIDLTKKRQRKADVTARAEQPNPMFGYCRVVRCGKPARAGKGDGLDRVFCRSHADHYARHGSPYKASYTAKALLPHRQEARRWLKVNRDAPQVQNAILRVHGLYQRAGPHVEAFRLRGLSPADRARATWARLRKADVDPLRVLEAWLSVAGAIAADPQPDNDPEFRRVQVAKLVHRLASGTHKSWPQPNGRVEVLHAYPRSRGRVLRHLGEGIEAALSGMLENATTQSPPT